MSLLKSLPHEIVQNLTALAHEQICGALIDEDDFEEMSEDEHEECMIGDMQVVVEMLKLLEDEGVSYHPMFSPKGQNI